jgi:competence protein ComFC
MGVQYSNLLATELRPKQSKLGKVERAKAMNPFYIKEDVDLTDKEILLFECLVQLEMELVQSDHKMFLVS